MESRISRPLCPFLLAILAAAFLACGGEDQSVAGAAQAAEAPETPPIAMVAAPVRREEISQPIFGTGTVLADKTTELGPVVPGIVDEILVREGDIVAKGDPLFRTRLVDYRIGQQEAAHAARLASAEANKAKRDLARAKQLNSQGVASQGQLDDALTAQEIASARKDVADSALARAQQNLTDTSVRAPYAGVISQRYVDEGVRMGGLAGPGAVVQLMKVDEVEVIVQVPEIHVGKLHRGMKARIHLDGTGGVFESEVERIHPQADPASRAIEVRIRLRNESGELRPGLFAKAELFPAPRTALTLERSAVLGSGQRRFVYRAVEGRAQRQFVSVQELDALRLEVLEGLSEDDHVLSGPNLPGVTEGAPVNLEVARADH